jgi:hypothetical protein
MGNSHLWTTNNGGMTFPISPPTKNPAAPGAIDNMAIGQTTPAPAAVSQIQVDPGVKTATAVAGAATLNKMAGVITSEALTTIAGADYVLTLTNLDAGAADQVMASVQPGTSTTGTPCIATVDPAAGSLKITVQNIHASAAFNGTIQISYVIFKN